MWKGGGEMTERKWKPYREGELEQILSLAPTKTNIKYLAKLLERSEGAIEIVYRIAYEDGPFGNNADIQLEKVMKAKQRVGIKIGRKSQ